MGGPANLPTLEMGDDGLTQQPGGGGQILTPQREESSEFEPPIQTGSSEPEYPGDQSHRQSTLRDAEAGVEQPRDNEGGGLGSVAAGEGSLEAPATTQSSFKYKPDADSLQGSAKKKRKRKVLFGIIGVFLVIFFLVILVQLFKAKYEALIIDDATKIAIDYMLEKRLKQYVNDYFAHVIFPEAAFCHGDITPECIDRADGAGLFKLLTAKGKQLALNKIENKLLVDPDGNKWRMEFDGAKKQWKISCPDCGANGTATVAENVAEDPAKFDLFSEVYTRNPVTATRLIMERLNVGEDRVGFFTNLLKRIFVSWRYGTSGCVFACTTLEKLYNAKLGVTDKIAEYKAMLLSIINDRVIEPIKIGATLLLGCVLDLSLSCLNKGGPEQDEAQEGQDVLAEDAVDESATVEAQASKGLLAALKEKVTGYLATLIAYALTKAGFDVTAKNVTDAVPYVGQVILAIQIAHFIGKLSTILGGGGLAISLTGVPYPYQNQVPPATRDIPMNLWNDVIKIPQAEQANNLLQAAAAEPTAELNGGIEAGAYDTNQIIASNELAGSTADVGRSKLYDYIAGGEYGQTTPGNTGAQTCRDGHPVPSNQLMCNEFRLDQEPPLVQAIRNNPILEIFLNSLSGLLNNPVVNGLDAIINFVFNLLGTLIVDLLKAIYSLLNWSLGRYNPLRYAVDLLGDIFKHCLPYVMKFFEVVFPPMIESLTEVIQTPWRLFDAAYTGASYASYQLATGGIDTNGQPYGLGGYDLNQQQSNQLISAANADYAANEAALPLGQKLFSITDPNSILARLTMSAPIPTNVADFTATLNPLNIFSMPFAAISQAPAHALLEYPSQDTNGVPTVGFAVNDKAWTSDPFMDPDTCTDNRQTNGVNAIGETNYTTGDMCLMDDAVGNIFLSGNGNSPN